MANRKSPGRKHRHREMRTLRKEGWLPASQAKEYSPDRYDFEWNANYSMFRPRKLLWWDDASYQRYQSEDWGGGKRRHPSIPGLPKITWSKWNRYTWYGTTEGQPKDMIQITDVTRTGGEKLYNYNVMGWSNITDEGLAAAKRKALEMLADRWQIPLPKTEGGGKRRHASPKKPGVGKLTRELAGLLRK